MIKEYKPTKTDKKYVIEQLEPTTDIKIVSKMQSEETGAVAYLINTSTNNWYILWSSSDLSDFEKDEEGAKNYFRGFIGKSDLI